MILLTRFGDLGHQSCSSRDVVHHRLVFIAYAVRIVILLIVSIRLISATLGNFHADHTGVVVAVGFSPD
jgi:hypothetical protein